MKNVLVIISILFIVVACAQKEQTVMLVEGTEAYDLAKALSEKLPALDPDSNKIIISTDYFDVSTGEVVQLLLTNFGRRVNQLKTMPGEEIKKIVEDNARGMAEKKLILRAANSADVSIATVEVDSVLEGYYKRSGGEDKYMNFLKSNNLTLEFVRESTKSGMIMQKYFETQVLTTIDISDQDVQDAYQKMTGGDKTATVRHILLQTEGKSVQEKANVRRKMEDLLKRARSGEDFTKLAQQYTEDPGSKETGGLYENFPRGQMVKAFEDAAFSVPIGEISDIVETTYGFHILKIIDRKRETKTIEEVRNQIVEDLRKARGDGAVDLHVTKLKEDAHFEKLVI